jgi:hypothetical protein
MIGTFNTFMGWPGRSGDDIEYYNEAEPTTTMCPLLPGQPMNVLNVPIILGWGGGFRGFINLSSGFIVRRLSDFWELPLAERPWNSICSMMI